MHKSNVQHLVLPSPPLPSNNKDNIHPERKKTIYIYIYV